jgi:hypothetical protein
MVPRVRTHSGVVSDQQIATGMQEATWRAGQMSDAAVDTERLVAVDAALAIARQAIRRYNPGWTSVWEESARGRTQESDPRASGMVEITRSTKERG